MNKVEFTQRYVIARSIEPRDTQWCPNRDMVAQWVRDAERVYEAINTAMGPT